MADYDLHILRFVPTKIIYILCSQLSVGNRILANCRDHCVFENLCVEFLYKLKKFKIMELPIPG